LLASRFPHKEESHVPQMWWFMKMRLGNGEGIYYGGGGAGSELMLLWLRLLSSHFISPFIMFASSCNSPTYSSSLLPVVRFSFTKQHTSRITAEFRNHFWRLFHNVFLPGNNTHKALSNSFMQNLQLRRSAQVNVNETVYIPLHACH
jgi:hypothetical protein